MRKRICTKLIVDNIASTSSLMGMNQSTIMNWKLADSQSVTIKNKLINKFNYYYELTN